MGVTDLMSDFILLRDIVGHDLNDIFNIQMWGLNFNSFTAADGRMEARSGVLVAMVATVSAAPPRNCVKIFTAYCPSQTRLS